jgi:hypothetical protein
VTANETSNMKFRPRKWHETKAVRGATFIIPLIWLVVFPFTGASIVHVHLQPLQKLNIWFPPVLPYSHWMALAISASIWLVLRRAFPNLSGIAAVFFCVLFLGCVMSYADHKITSIPTLRFLTDQEQAVLKAHLSFNYMEISRSGVGTQVVIPKDEGYKQRMVEELRKLDVLR